MEGLQEQYFMTVNLVKMERNGIAVWSIIDF